MTNIQHLKDLIMRMNDEDQKRYVSNIDFLDVYFLARYLSIPEISRLGDAMGEKEKETLLKLNVILPVRMHTIYEPVVERLLLVWQKLKSDGLVTGNLAEQAVNVNTDGAPERIILFREIALGESTNDIEEIRKLTELRMAAEANLKNFDLKTFLSEALPLFDSVLGDR